MREKIGEREKAGWGWWAGFGPKGQKLFAALFFSSFSFSISVFLNIF